MMNNVNFISLLQKSSSTLQPKRPLSAITEKYKVTLRCPICGQRTIIPIGGVSRVPKNFLLERQLTDAIENLQAKQSPSPGCSQCNDQDGVIFWGKLFKIWMKIHSFFLSFIDKCILC